MASTKRRGAYPVVFDEQTGEAVAIADDNIDWDPFGRYPLPMMVRLFQIKDWSPTETRLLFYLLAMCDQNNMVHMHAGEIREVLGVTQAQMSHAVNGLCDKNIVTKCRYYGRAFYFMINPAYFRRFEDKLLSQYLADYQAARVAMWEREKRGEAPPVPQDYAAERKTGKAALRGEKRQARGVAIAVSEEE